jgi:disulfide bond formation protein DsbB
MTSITPIVVKTLSLLTIVGQILSVILIICLVVEALRKNRPSPLLAWCSRSGLVLMLVVSAVATTGSLYFSEVALWTPCKDCWIQRIFMYPQVILLLIALWRRDRGIAFSILALSVIGAGFAIDHYIDQVMAALYPVVVDPAVPCDTTGVSCAATQIHFTFGYITIPLMAFTAFILNALGSFTMIRSKHE